MVLSLTQWAEDRPVADRRRVARCVRAIGESSAILLRPTSSVSRRSNTDGRGGVSNGARRAAAAPPLS